ncbi:hypothetical protein K6V98_01850 [Collinsella sp. AGMB00827]|uniref:Streptococcal pilin isopeptide linker domain-containing protein n=1 Tax=Collinsella ureilytica TaxID=2869515 RepID=A0ABS7MJA5_9ACTN|nr:hypothetical protein [Collinsella urealyticum]MBY4797108.1 hypothetical protein [Collinsella urealyticum]
MKVQGIWKQSGVGRFAAMLLALVAVLGFSTPVFAEGVPTSNNNEVTITKTLQGATTALPTGQEFTFTFTPLFLNGEDGAATAEETPTIDAKTITIGTGNGNFIMKKVNGATTTLTKNLKFDVTQGLTFPHAGVYGWTVVETDGGVENVSYSKAS